MRERRTSAVGFSDLLTAVEALSAQDPSVVSRIAALLDVEAALVEHEPPVVETTEVLEVSPAYAPGATAPPPPGLLRQTVPSAITRRLERRPLAAPIVALPVVTDEANEPRPPFEPLLESGHVRAMAAAALATTGAGGPVDIDGAVARLATGRAITALPRAAWPTLRKGAQVLVDRASGMVPFARDAEWLLHEMLAVAGGDNAQALYFRGLPSRGVTDRRRRLRLPYEPPQPGVPVVLLSDFAIGHDDMASDRASAEEWIAFLQALRKRGNPCLAFVPYPRRRWPGWLPRLATVIEWDRRTTVGHIRNAMRASWSSR